MSLAERLLDPGFTPGARHFDELLALLEASGDDAERIEKALSRAGEAVVAPVTARLSAATGGGRSRLATVLGRVAAGGAPAAVVPLRSLLADDDIRTRGMAARWLGKVPGDENEDALLARWESETRVEVRRALAEALGKIGGPRALAALAATPAALPAADAELARIAANAITVLTREAARGSPSAIADDVAPPAPLPLVFHTRAGLEDILAEELAGWGAKVVGKGVVTATLRGPLSSVHVARTWISFGLRVPAVPVRGEIDDAIASAVTSRPARDALTRFTRGAIRFRLAFPDGAHHRALAWSVARKVRERAPTLVNDPTASTWEILIAEREKVARIELSPRAMSDPRFDYRVRDVPAASHPAIAAALARLAGAREGDVVWDPFCGSGLELIERARLGPCKRLVGTDLDAKALDAARANLDAAGVDARLVKGDARDHRVDSVSLIISNPPMGRRVGTKAELGPLLDDCLASWAGQLVRGGRIVWISAMAGTANRAERLGLAVTMRRDVDMGGFTAQIQIFTKP